MYFISGLFFYCVLILFAYLIDCTMFSKDTISSYIYTHGCVDCTDSGKLAAPLLQSSWQQQLWKDDQYWHEMAYVARLIFRLHSAALFGHDSVNCCTARYVCLHGCSKSSTTEDGCQCCRHDIRK